MQAMPMMGALPYGMTPAGAPMTIATPYGTQLAANHGVAGFGQMPPPAGQQFIGQPLIVGAGYPQNTAFIQQAVSYHILRTNYLVL